MDIEHCQQQFQQILQTINKSQVVPFLKWTQYTTENMLKEIVPSSQGHSPDVSTEEAILNQIQSDLREALPLNAVVSSEQIVQAQGKNADCDQRTTVHVDGFLYDEDAIDELVDEGKLSRNYCEQCGSRQVSPLTFISHSTSKTQLRYLFQYLLPDLRNKLVVDIGSRLGSVLYGAYLYTGANHVVGIEMNSELCTIQQTVIQKYSMQDRVQVICDDVCNQPDILGQADVILMNNVFEFFLTPELQKRVWSIIQQSARKPGSLLVTSPSLEECLQPLQLLCLLEGWVKPVHRPEQLLAAEKAMFENPEDSDLSDMYLYTIL